LVCRQGEDGDHLYFVNKGEVAISIEILDLKKRPKDLAITAEDSKSLTSKGTEAV